jgi:hypothetical protein
MPRLRGTNRSEANREASLPHWVLGSGNATEVGRVRMRVLLGIALAATIAADAATGLAAGMELVPMQDSDGQFLISAPPAWRVDWSRKDPVFSAKSPEPRGTSPDTLEVFVRDMPLPLTPEGCLSQVTWVMRMTIHTWTTLSEGPDTIGGLAAYSRAYTWRLKTGEERRSIQTCVTLGRRMFVIIGTTANTPRRVAHHLPELARMIASFRPGRAPLPADPDPRGPSDR